MRTASELEEGEVGVYVNLTRVSTSDQPIENATIVGEEMVRWLRDIEGYRGFLMLSREGTTLGLSFWETREMAERHRVSRMQFIDRMTSAANVQVEEMLDFDVTFAELKGVFVLAEEARRQRIRRFAWLIRGR